MNKPGDVPNGSRMVAIGIGIDDEPDRRAVLPSGLALICVAPKRLATLLLAGSP